MATTIKIKNSVTAAGTPSSLAQGELAVNITDKKMWVGNAATTPIQILGAGVTNDAGGSNTQVQYNSSGVLAGSANMTFNGTTLTLANDASISGLTVGRGGSAITQNTAYGTTALTANTSGIYNTAIGYQSMLGTTTGSRNTAVGERSLVVNTTGAENTAVGELALYSNNGSYNTALGRSALETNTTASNNTAVGYQAGFSNNSAELTAIGYRAAYNSNAVENTAVGALALFSNTSGYTATAVGRAALYANTTGVNNTACGDGAMNNNTTGANNTALGLQAGYSNTTNSQSTYLGAYAGYLSTGGSGVFVGQSAGYNTTGNNNTFLGQNSGSSVTSGNANSILGAFNGNQNGLNIATSSNYIVLSDGGGNWMAYVQAAGGGWYQKNNSATWSITSDARIKENVVEVSSGLDVITALRPVEFDYIVSKKHDIGFIAQEYAQVLPDQITKETSASDEIKALTNGDEVLGIQQNLVPYLVKAIQELNAKITALENK
jgi:hypothetical protein